MRSITIERERETKSVPYLQCWKQPTRGEKPRRFTVDANSWKVEFGVPIGNILFKVFGMFDLCASLLVPNAIGTYRMSYAVGIQLDGRTDREHPFNDSELFSFFASLRRNM